MLPKNTNQTLWWLGGGVVVVLTAIFLLIVPRLTSAPSTPPPVTPTCADCTPRAIDGVLVPAEVANLRPLAVMVENHFESWPQAGLDRAQLVYEAVTEGAISRFMAVYAADEAVELIGPVRSARPYFVDWAEELGAIYAHSGGSDAALAQAKRSRRMDDLNEFYHGRYFWRAAGHVAPHNLFTSTDRLRQYVSDAELSSVGDYPTWNYIDATAESADQIEAGVISFNYSPSATYQVAWHYDAAAGEYVRWQNGAPHQMAAGAVITAKNIIWQFTDTETIDAIGRKKITTTGQGEVWLARSGQLIKGSWRRGGTDQRTKFFDSAGEPMTLLRGTTWVEIIPIGLPVDVSPQ